MSEMQEIFVRTEKILSELQEILSELAKKKECVSRSTPRACKWVTTRPRANQLSNNSSGLVVTQS